MDLLTSSEKAWFTDQLQNHFDTFKRTITVHKAPRLIRKTSSKNVYAGYGTPSNPEIVETVPVSQSFDAIVVYDQNAKTNQIENIQTQSRAGMMKIKVEKAARDYIMDEKTEYIEIDSNKFNVITSEGIQHYLGLLYYVFNLQNTL